MKNTVISTYLIIIALLLSACGGSGNAPTTAKKNNAPIAVADSYKVENNLTLSVLDNDSDPDGDLISIASVTQPAHGSVAINGNSIDLVIDQNFVGFEKFTYTISDSKGATSTAEVGLELSPTNKPPIANNDRVIGERDVILFIDALSNDSDVNGDVLTITEITQTANGSVNIEADGTIRYIPNSGFVGEDSLSYTITDNSFTSTAAITIVINESNGVGNQKPVTTADEFSVLFETDSTLDVLANDTDPENDVLTITEILGPDHGTVSIVTISSGGLNTDAIQYLPDNNYIGIDSLIYILSDGTQSTAETVSIEVKTQSQNNVPSAKDDFVFTTIDTSATFNPFINDSDLDNDKLSVVSISVPRNGNLLRDEKGTLNDFSDDVFTYIPFTGFTGTDSVTYYLSDSFSEDPAVINFEVNLTQSSSSQITGSVHKGPVTGAVVTLYESDQNGQAILNNPIVSASTESDGSWAVSVPSEYDFLIAGSQGGNYIDESVPDINATTKRRVTLSNDTVLESVWQSGQQHVSLNAYTSALLRKARIESNNSIQVTVENNRAFSLTAFGFDPFSTRPTSPLNPEAGATTEQLNYAVFLGGFANALNASTTKLNLSTPTTPLLNALISDFSDCILNANQFGAPLPVDTGLLVNVTEINTEIRRFRNNNFQNFPGLDPQINIPACQQSGVSTDKTPPTITLIGANPLLLDVGTGYVELGATASDDENGIIKNLTTKIEIDSTSIDSSVLASYLVNYSVTDRSGNTTQVNRTVNVIDRTIPVISLIGNAVVEIEIGQGFTDLGATAVDNFDGDITANIVVTSNLDLTTNGSYEIVYSVSDSSNNLAIEVIRQINIIDRLSPSLALFGSNPQTVLVLEPYVEFGARAIDVGDGDISNLVTSDGATAVDTSAVGTYTVTYIITDQSGNSTQAVRQVNVVDIIAPVINLQGFQVLELEVGTAYIDAGAVANDQLDGDVSANIVTDESALNINAIGSYQITYNVSDTAGNAADEQVRRVNIVDTQIPEISLIGANPLTLEAGSVFTEPGFIANDNVDGDISSNVLVDNSTLNLNSPGTYIISYNVSDRSGNAAIEVTRTIIIEDVTPPVITIQGSNPQTILVLGTYTELGASVIDSNEGDISSSLVINSAAVNTGVPGTYQVTYNAQDSFGNMAIQQIRNVDVVDSTNPVITILGSNPINIEAGSVYTDSGASATDSVDMDLSSSIVVTNTVNSSIIGSYTVAYNVSDSAGNAATEQIRNVNVADTTSPLISLLGTQSTVVEAGTVYTDAGATAIDSFEGDLTSSIIVTGNVDTSVVGVYSLTYSVQDSSANASSVTRTVRVEDTTPPIITVVGADPLIIPFSSTFTDPGATATDNLDGDVTARIFADTSEVNTLILGDYTVRYDVNDAAGNSAIQASRIVRVVANTITLNINIINDNGGIAAATDFVPSIDSVNTSWGTAVKLSTGPHVASTSTLLGYAISAWSGDCLADGSVTLVLGQSAVCEVTVDDEIAKYTMVKSASPNIVSMPSNITYTYLFTNIGTQDLKQLTVTDVGVLSGCPIATLAPGNSASCTATYAIDQNQIDSGLDITHSATSNGFAPDGITAVTEDDTANDNGTIITVSQTPSASVSTTPDVTSVANANTVINYAFMVNNTGNVTLTTVSVSDDRATGIVCNDTTINVGGNTTCSASYTVSQTDIDAGLTLANNVTARSNEAVDATARSTVTVIQSPSATISSTPDVASVTNAGDVINYNYVMTNTGNVSLNGVGVTDDRAIGLACTGTSINVGGSITCSASYTATQTDIDAGLALNNVVTAISSQAANVSANSTVTVIQNPTASLSSTPDVAFVSNNGDVINYNYVMNNTGNVTLTAVSVTDDRAVGITCSGTSINVGANITCTASYAVSQPDIDSGAALVNNATASSNEAADASASSSVTVIQNPTASLSSTPDVAFVSNDGDVINYNYVMNNTGNVTLTGVSVTDDRAIGITCSGTSINVGANITCTASYTVSQSDIDSGAALVNNATASSNEAADASASSSVTVVQTPSATVRSTPNVNNVMGANEVITYSFVINNTGNVTITGVSVSDDRVVGITCNATTINVGGSTSCTGTYTVTQVEMDAGLALVNTVTVASNETADISVSSSVAITQSPSVIATSSPDKASVSVLGEVIVYTFTLTNNGNIKLSNLSAVDSLAGVANCTGNVIQPGTSTECNASYTVTQLDLDTGGTLINTVTVGTSDTIDRQFTSSVSISQLPKYTLVPVPASVVDGDGNDDDVGDTIPYSFTFTNTGNVTLTNVSLSVPSLVISCPGGDLMIGIPQTCSASYTLTQNDMDNGSVTFTAAPTLTSSDGVTAVVEDDLANDNTIVVSLIQNPIYTMAKTAGTVTDLDANGDDVNDTVTYTYSFVNTGNVTLNTLNITDAGALDACPIATLAVSASASCTSTYTLTQPDVDAGFVMHSATSSALAPDGITSATEDDAANDNSTNVTITQSPAITISGIANQTNDTDGSGSVTPGDELTYIYTVTNTGNISLTDVEISDQLSNAGIVSCTLMAPSTTCILTGTYIVNTLDVDPVTFRVENVGTAASVTVGPSSQVTVSTPVFFADPLDFDGDGLSNDLEAELKLSLNPDFVCLSPTNPDSDDDGLSDGVEYNIGTSPCVFAPADSVKTIPATEPFPANPDREPEYGTAAEPIVYLVESGVYPGSINLGIGSSTAACQYVTYVGSLSSGDSGQKPALGSDNRPTTILDMQDLDFSHVRDCDTIRISNIVLTNGIGFDSGGGNTRGGGMRVADGSTVILDNVWVEDNSVADQGGGIAISSAGTVLEIRNSVIRGNEVIGTGGANKGGGAIWVGDKATLIMDNTRIYNNRSAAVGGGGIYLDLGSTSTITNSFIANNRSTGTSGGGGILASNLGGGIEVTAHIANNIISGNDSTNNGGGLSIIDGSNKVKLYNNLIIGNYAASGAGVYINADSILRNNTLAYNQSTNPGAAITVAAGAPVIKDSVFWENRAGDNQLTTTTATGDTFVPAALYTYSSYNLIGSPEGNAINDQPSTDPLFDLAFYHGVGSPATNTGSVTSAIAETETNVKFTEKTTDSTGTFVDDLIGDGLQLNKGYHYAGGSIGTTDQIIIQNPSDFKLIKSDPVDPIRNISFIPVSGGIKVGDGQDVQVVLSANPANVVFFNNTTLQPLGADSDFADHIGDGVYQFSLRMAPATTAGTFDITFSVNGSIFVQTFTVEL